MHVERGHTRNICKACRNAKRRTYAATPQARAKNREACAAWRLELHQSGLTNGKVAEIKKNYGLTPDEFNTMLNAQNSKCKICKEPLSAGRGGSVVDHCHKTERIRGLLCNGCNSGIGWFRENPARLLAAIAYLEDSKCDQAA